MRATVGLLTLLLWFGTGCSPKDVPYGAGDSRPGAAQDDTGTDQPPSGTSSENNVPANKRTPGDPSSPATPPR